MKPVVKNVLAVVVGVVASSVVNMSLVTIGPMVIPLPEGADVSTTEAMAESMKLFTPINFLFPFLAHALGTLVGAFLAAKIAGSHRIAMALVIGAFSLFGGIMAVRMFPGPLWFEAADLILAYIPMSYLGAVLAGATKPAD